MSATVAVSVHVVPEDSGAWADKAWPALVRKLCRHLDPACATQRVAVTTLQGRLRSTVSGVDRWRNDVSAHRDIARSLANRLRVGEIVVWHVDADVAWKTKRRASPNLKAIEAVLAHVRRDPRLEEPALERLLIAMPFAHIEAWLYLNEAAFKELGRDDSSAWWDRARGELGFDHLADAKRACPLHDAHNEVLATRAFPFAQAVATSPSLRAWVDGARRDPVVALLASAR